MVPSGFKVCVRCFTYNQAAFIKDALDGFTMQETTFPYVCCIVDDASTDGEQKVVLDYLEEHFIQGEDVECQRETDYASIHFRRHKTNKNCYFAVLFLKVNCYRQPDLKFNYISPWRSKCEYEAMCEGDDYWINPQKLQIQVDYLDSNQDSGMCYTNFNVLLQNRGELLKDMAASFPKKFPMEYESLDSFILQGGYVCPPSWVYKMASIDDYSPIIGSCDGTFVMFSHFLAKYKAHYIPVITSTYRILDESASHTTDLSKKYNRKRGVFQLQLALIERYGLSENTRRSCVTRFFRDNLRFFMINGMDEDVFQAHQSLDKKLPKEKLEFFLYKSRIGRSVMKCFFRIEKEFFKFIPGKITKF